MGKIPSSNDVWPFSKFFYIYSLVLMATCDKPSCTVVPILQMEKLSAKRFGRWPGDTERGFSGSKVLPGYHGKGTMERCPPDFRT